LTFNNQEGELTIIRTVRESFKQLEEEQQYNIKDFNMMSIKERLSMIEGYLQSLEHEQPEELDKLQADYNNLLGKYRGLQQRNNNIVDNVKKEEDKKMIKEMIGKRLLLDAEKTVGKTGKLKK